MAESMVKEMAIEAVEKARPLIASGIIKWDKGEDALTMDLEKQLWRVITMAQQGNGYASIQSIFFTTAMPKDRGASIDIQISKWIGCGFVMTPKALRPQIQKLIRELPSPKKAKAKS